MTEPNAWVFSWECPVCGAKGESGPFPIASTHKENQDNIRAEVEKANQEHPAHGLPLRGKISLSGSAYDIVTEQLLASLRDREYRNAFVCERTRSSTALQIRALRAQREMTQKELGTAIGTAQAWVSKLENPNYGKMTMETLLRLANAFDTDLEIKFRPFSRIIRDIPDQGKEYFAVPGFEDEFGPS